MAYMASIQTILKTYNGKVVGDGQTVRSFVEAAAHAPRTASWRKGARVKGNTAVTSGTAIATFDSSGKYGNHTNGRSHAAIFDSQTQQGIVVYDQWAGQPVHKRTILFRDGH